MRSIVIGLALCAAACVPVLASDWTNAGGGPGRNGQSDEVGPVAPTQIWSGGRSSIIAWQPVTAGRRVFMVRQLGFVPSGVPNEAPLVAQDLDTGAELWVTNLPYNAGDWTTWVAGCSNGLVYASRAGNGGSIAAALYAFDQDSGNPVWVSQETIKTGAYDGVVFADDGDPIVAWHQAIRRIDADTGLTVWTTPRVGSVSGNCGVAIHGDAVYSCEVVPGGHAIKRFDLATGAAQYVGPTMPGFTVQNVPMVGPDGTIYLSRTQNNLAVDFFYAFTDDGSAITQAWSVPAAWSTSSEFAVGPDGSVYMLAPGNVLARLDPATGATLNTSTVLATGSITPRLAVDWEGKVYASNGGSSNGKVFAFNPDLTLRWSLNVTNVNIGAPVLGEGGTLVIAGTGTNVRAYRSPSVWTPTDGALAGASGEPVLEGKGSATVGYPVALRGSNGMPFMPAWLFLGTSRIDAPLFGGTLVPTPTVVIGPFSLDANGGFEFGAPWPAGVPSGVGLWMQAWSVDAGGPQGFAATNGLKLTTP